MTGHLAGMGTADYKLENRDFTARPAAPVTLEEMRQWPERYDAFLDDHFGFRQDLVRANNFIRHYFLRESPSSVITKGKEGYLFLNSVPGGEPLARLINICSHEPASGQRAKRLKDQIDIIYSFFRARGLPLTIMLIPGKAKIYPERLPDNLPFELKANCGAAGPGTIPALMRLYGDAPSIKDTLYYPLDEFRALKNTIEIFPNYNYHWRGAGPHYVATKLLTDYFKIEPLTNVPSERKTSRFDLYRLLPGLDLRIDNTTYDYRATRVFIERNAPCYARIREFVENLTFVQCAIAERNNSRRLLILADSFGDAVTNPFSMGFSRVLLVRTNQVRQAEIAPLVSNVIANYQPTDVLLLKNEYGALGLFRRIARGLEQAPPDVTHQVATYELGDVIDFGRTGNARSYLFSGWSQASDQATQTAGPRADLVFAPREAPQTDLEIELEAAPAQGQALDVDLSINDTKITTWQFNRDRAASVKTTTLRRELINQDRVLRIELVMRMPLPDDTFNNGQSPQAGALNVRRLRLSPLN